ncbi:MAG: hypothetical protein HY719_03705 [Planctomycetes bacterium]|nr:hypothetical protein [Planctomycetota bacterium]
MTAPPPPDPSPDPPSPAERLARARRVARHLNAVLLVLLLAAAGAAYLVYDRYGETIWKGRAARPDRGARATAPLAVKPAWWVDAPPDPLAATDYDAAAEEIEKRFGPSNDPRNALRVLRNLLALRKEHPRENIAIWFRCAEVLNFCGEHAAARREYVALEEFIADKPNARAKYAAAIHYRMYMLLLRAGESAAARARLESWIKAQTPGTDGRVAAVPRVAAERKVDLELAHWDRVHREPLGEVLIFQTGAFLPVTATERPARDPRAQEEVLSDRGMFTTKYQPRRWRKQADAAGATCLQHPARPGRRCYIRDLWPPAPRHEGFTRWDAVLVINRERELALLPSAASDGQPEEVTGETAAWWQKESALCYTLTTTAPPALVGDPPSVLRRVILFWPDSAAVMLTLLSRGDETDDALRELDTLVAGLHRQTEG